MSPISFFTISGKIWWEPITDNPLAFLFLFFLFTFSHYSTWVQDVSICVLLELLFDSIRIILLIKRFGCYPLPESWDWGFYRILWVIYLCHCSFSPRVLFCVILPFLVKFDQEQFYFIFSVHLLSPFNRGAYLYLRS